jgi:hypothetical protein
MAVQPGLPTIHPRFPEGSGGRTLLALLERATAGIAGPPPWIQRRFSNPSTVRQSVRLK